MTTPRLLSDLEALHAAATKAAKDYADARDTIHLRANLKLAAMDAHEELGDSLCEAFPAMLRALRAAHEFIEADTDERSKFGTASVDKCVQATRARAAARNSLAAALAALGEAKEAGR